MQAPAADELAVGQLVELDIGPVAHGGICVARYEGRVVFVRHALPGERAVVRLTQVKAGSFCRGEAEQILTRHPERVTAPCSHFHPGGCGGCDWQHASASLQRDLKAAVIVEQLQRLAGLTVDVTVEALAGDGFGWRTRVRWALDEDGRIGPRAVRSHLVVGVTSEEPCLIAAPGLTELATVADPPPDIRRRGRHAGRGHRDRTGLPEVTLVHPEDGVLRAVWAGEPAPVVSEHAWGRAFSVAADGFWQVHPAAADTLAAAVDQALTGIDLTGGSAWDLYGGVGLFAQVLADRVGPTGSVVTVEGDAPASALAAENLADSPGVSAVRGSVEEVLAELPLRVDAVVLDPPRSGAGKALCAEIAARQPAVIVYVACDPAALGRDTAALGAAGYRLDALRAFDCFPQTHHVECVARFVPSG